MIKYGMRSICIFLWLKPLVFVNFVGRDIGTNLPSLLKAIVAELPPDASTMLRIGMTNPPFILEHLKEIAEALRHPCVYSFLHVPVQSGSDAVLAVSTKHTCLFLVNIGRQIIADAFASLLRHYYVSC